MEKHTHRELYKNVYSSLPPPSTGNNSHFHSQKNEEIETRSMEYFSAVTKNKLLTPVTWMVLMDITCISMVPFI